MNIVNKINNFYLNKDNNLSKRKDKIKLSSTNSVICIQKIISLRDIIVANDILTRVT